jgi:hypothetical protein
MAKMPNETLSPAHLFELPEHDSTWLESLQLSHAPTEDRHTAVDFLNNEMRMPYKNGAVFKAFNSGEIPTAFVSGRALASAYDLARWALTRKYVSRERDRNRFTA